MRINSDERWWLKESGLLLPVAPEVETLHRLAIGTNVPSFCLKQFTCLSIICNCAEIN